MDQAAAGKHRGHPLSAVPYSWGGSLISSRRWLARRCGREGSRFGSAARPDFREDLTHVMLGGFGADDQPIGNLAVR